MSTHSATGLVDRDTKTPLSLTSEWVLSEWICHIHFYDPCCPCPFFAVPLQHWQMCTQLYEAQKCTGVQQLTHLHTPLHFSTPNIKNLLLPPWQLQQVKSYTVALPASRCRWAAPMQLPHSQPPSWQSIPISTWMVFNYVPRGYHGSSISSVWQCNSLCPAAMSAKLRQFTCSCSYIALGKSDLPSILCIHLISGKYSLTPPTWAVTGVISQWGRCFWSLFQCMAT